MRQPLDKLLLKRKSKINNFPVQLSKLNNFTSLINKITAYMIIFILCVSTACFSGCTSANAKGFPIVFNEIVSSNSFSLADSKLGSPDWIELYNNSDKEVNLSGYGLISKNKAKSYTFQNITLAARGYLIVYADGNSGDTKNTCCDFSISKNGEDLFLLDPKGNVASQVEVPALQTDISYARKSDGTYGYCMSTTPGAGNSEPSIMDLDKLEKVLKSGKIYISEVLPKNSSGDAWVELYNLGDIDIDLSNYCLSDDQGEPAKWQMPKQTLKVGEYAVVKFSGESFSGDSLCASFKLGDEDTGVYLFDISRNLISAMTWDEKILEDISALPGGEFSGAPTPGKANTGVNLSSATPQSMNTDDPVRINEVLVKNKYSITDHSGDRVEWVELYNDSTQVVSLKGYYLSDKENNLFKWAFPDTNIAAKNYLIVFLSGKQSTKDELHASFRLSESESALYLTNRNSMRYDRIQLSAKLGENISVGYTDGKLVYYALPTPGSINARGFESLNAIGYFDKSGLYISEVCAANKPKTRQNDWVELHNASSATVDLSGYYLSDDKEKPQKWKISSLSMDAGGYAVIETSSDESRNKNIANFGISPSGETLMLSDKAGNILDVFNTGVLQEGITSGRIESDNTINRVFFTAPSKGKANSTQKLNGHTAKPVLSDTKLYHSQSFQLSITCKTAGAKIYYTLDGSAPTQSSKRYETPVNITKNTVIRAAAYADSMVCSEEASATYLFGARHTVPVVSITGEYSKIRSILGANSKSRKESPVNIEYYESDGSMGIAFPAGLRVKGRASLRFAQNSLTMALRSDYGVNSITYPFFEGSKVSTFSTLSLRSSGQDIASARIRDSYFQTLSEGLNVDNMNTKIVVVYINGTYYGLYDLNEEQNDDYFYSYYGIESDNFDKISRNGTVMKGDSAEYKRITRMARSLNTSNDKDFAEFAKYVDVDSCTDYLIAQIYFGNGDIVNQRYWRARDYSVKWRPLLVDLDFCLRFNDAHRNVFRKYLTRSPSIGAGLSVNMYIFCALRENKGWRDKFIERFVQLAETNFKTERILAVYDKMISTMRTEMARHIARWHKPSSMKSWENQITRLRSAIERRHDIVLKQLQSYFGVSDATLQAYIKKYSTTN
jgi:hypothetical protein